MCLARVEVHEVTRVAGEGGHISYRVDIKTDEGAIRKCTFNGNMFVGPVVLTSTDDAGGAHAVVIDEPRRFGEFAAEEWVHRFFAEW